MMKLFISEGFGAIFGQLFVAIASPSTYPCQWVINSFRFGDSYRISKLCELVSITPTSQIRFMKAKFSKNRHKRRGLCTKITITLNHHHLRRHNKDETKWRRLPSGRFSVDGTGR